VKFGEETTSQIGHNDLDNTRLPILLELDRGEKQTIALALKEKESLVVIDEKIGRNIAEYLGLKVTGTLGVPVRAKRMKGLKISNLI